MWIEAGQFRHFRNYTQLQLDWVPHKNLFIGQNAAGKTNILEAIYFLSHGKSYRTHHDRELIQFGEPFSVIKLLAHSNRMGGDLALEAQLTLTPENALKTVFKINGNPIRNRSEILGKLPTVTFFLSDLAMLRGAPEDRRRALDSALTQFDPSHFKRLSLYQRIRQQKSQFLKQHPSQMDPHLWESLNQKLVEAGAALVLNRFDYLQRLETLCELRYLELSQGLEPLSIQYQPSFPLDMLGVVTLETIQDAMRQAIESASQEEQRRGQVLVGPHRDDVRFYLNQQDASLYGSQGQQRSIVLAFKLAEIHLLEQRLADETPILLLDDVMAELDPTRQHQLLAHLEDRMQVFLTTTHLDSELKWYLHGAPSSRIFVVSQGQVAMEQMESLQTHG